MSKQNFKKTEATANVIPETARMAWQDFFSEVKKRCLDRNFGTLSKSEFDLMLFHYYLQNKQEEVGSRYVSDYDIGRDLGLTIQRVRSLREREALKWRSQEDWKEKFLKCLKYARYDEKSDAVKILVPDVNVIREVRNFIETAGLIDDYQLNPKVFQCNMNALIAICLDFKSGSDDNLCGKILNELRESKDEKVARAVGEQEHPILTTLQKTVIKGVKDSIALIPGVGKAGGEFVAQLLEKLR